MRRSRRRPKAGLDVIVVDHHIGEPALAPAIAVDRPQPARRREPRRAQLGAVGVAFLLAVAINRALRGSGWYKAQARARPDGLARSRGARHGVRRGAAHRPQPRAGGAGPSSSCASAAMPGSPRSPTSPASPSRSGPIMRASSWGRASMPAAGSARPISARGCWRPTIPPRRRDLASAAPRAQCRAARDRGAACWTQAVAQVERTSRGARWCSTARRRLASRRHRHRREPPQGALWTARPASSP